MFGRVNFWQIAESKLVGEKVWQMDRLSHTISEIWMALFGESQTICQTFPPKDTAYFARNHLYRSISKCEASARLLYTYVPYVGKY